MENSNLGVFHTWHQGGLAPKILVGFFTRGPQKKSTNQADLKKEKVMMLRGPRLPPI
jgi:hypothetical protein